MMRFFTSDLRRNIIKIVCLTLGLAIGFLLVAKVYFEGTYDTFFPDSDRLYILTESVEMNGEFREYQQTPGAIAPGIKRYAPPVEHATRYTNLLSDKVTLQTEEGGLFEVDRVLMADSCFFDVLGTEIIAGDPHEALSVKSSLMIPESLAKKMGGDPLGKALTYPDMDPDQKFIIRGIYKDFPLNSSIPNAVYLSLESIGMFSYDGRDMWMGNDRYHSLVRLVKDADPKDLQPYVTQMLRDNINEEDLEISNFNIGTTPLVGNYTSNGAVQTMIWILSLLAVVMLMCAGLNYLLVTIGQIGVRSKEMAIRKCYGTSNAKIFCRVMGESIFYLLVSMGLAILLVFCLSDICQRLLGYTPAQLFATGEVWMLEGAVCIVLLIVTGVAPSWIYCRTPVAHSFSAKVKNRKVWKLALLFIQFFASSLLICVLTLVGRQYSHVSMVDIGMEYENVGIMDFSYLPESVKSTLVAELRQLSCVESVATADDDFLSWSSGNNVWIGDDVEKEVNIADLYYANRDIVDVLGMKIIEGSTFDEITDSTSHQVIVEEKFYDVLRKAGADVQKGNLVGQTFNISDHGYEQNGVNSHEYTICGVVRNMKRGGYQNENSDKRAAVMFPAQNFRRNLYIRFNSLNQESMREAQDVVKRIVSEKERYITPYKELVMSRTESVKQFGLAVMVIGVAILVIALIGLVGYTADEVQFRSKEVAIRKVSGYTANKIVRLFIRDIFRIALPATILGGIVAIPVGRKWLSQFTEQASLMPALNIVCIVLLLIIIACVVASSTLSIARDNPVRHLHRE